jgi:two-component SAPR family response regulator
MKKLQCIGIADDVAEFEMLQCCCSLVPALCLQTCFTDPYKALAVMERNRIDLVFVILDRNAAAGAEFMKYVQPGKKIILIGDGDAKEELDANPAIPGMILKPLSFTTFFEAIKLASVPTN